MYIFYKRMGTVAKRIISVPQITLNEGIKVMDDLYGKYDQSNLIDNNFTDGFQFPAMRGKYMQKNFNERMAIGPSKSRET